MRPKKYSYDKINYILRPCKQIERKIMLEVLGKLKLKRAIEEYKYIGMGSIHYYDFILIHKYLCIKDLISIDNKKTRRRFEFNRPYEFVKFKKSKTTDFLSTYTWDKNDSHLIWLDYDGGLENYMLEDIALVIQNCNKQDILIVTIDGRCPPELDENNKKRKPREEFWDNFSMFTSSHYKNSSDVCPENFPDIIQNICINYIKDKDALEDNKFNQFFCFKYADTAEMFTFGGIIDENDDSLKPVEKHDFVSLDGHIIEIDIPILTYHEKIHLDKEIEKCIKIKEDYLQQIKTVKNSKEKKKVIKKFEKKMNDTLKFELTSIDDLIFYTDYCKYYPQYYEGLI